MMLRIAVLQLSVDFDTSVVTEYEISSARYLILQLL
jgi:hypothetical protein